MLPLYVHTPKSTHKVYLIPNKSSRRIRYENDTYVPMTYVAMEKDIQTYTHIEIYRITELDSYLVLNGRE